MFTPYSAIVESVTTTGTVYSLPVDSNNINLYKAMLVTNTGTENVYVNLGDSSVVYNKATSICILPGVALMLSRGQTTHVAIATASSTSEINFVLGIDN